jgi:hypothetical protein
MAKIIRDGGSERDAMRFGACNGHVYVRVWVLHTSLNMYTFPYLYIYIHVLEENIYGINFTTSHTHLFMLMLLCVNICNT